MTHITIIIIGSNPLLLRYREVPYGGTYNKYPVIQLHHPQSISPHASTTPASGRVLSSISIVRAYYPELSSGGVFCAGGWRWTVSGSPREHMSPAAPRLLLSPTRSATFLFVRRLIRPQSGTLP